MGGQACILYGAAEFSRDTDLALFLSKENIELFRSALRELHARRIALPPFDPSYLEKGHAIHFRCYHPDAMRMRVDVMSVMRGVDAFEQLWERRTTLEESGGLTLEVLSLPDLVKAKKTQRRKDWEMIRRLVEADYAAQHDPSPAQVQFWLMEARTPELLVQLAEAYRDEATGLAFKRPLIRYAVAGDIQSLEVALQAEQMAEMENDRRYWQPLRKELEDLRQAGYSSEEDV